MANEKLKLPVLNFAGSQVGEIDLPEYPFGEEVDEIAVQRAVRIALANRRSDTAHTLDRSVVHGSNRKPFRQKGTGRARAGTTNSPVWRHGGVVHGPDGNQNHALKMNRQEYRIALASVLADKVNNGNVIVLTDEEFTSAKTKDAVAALKAINADAKKNLLILNDDGNDNLLLAGWNIANLCIEYFDEISVYDILNANKIILVKGAETCIAEYCFGVYEQMEDAE